MRLFRRREVPDAVRAVPLPAGERRLAWALTDAGEPVLATGAALLLPGREPVPWRQVEKAVWQRPVLTVTELAAGPAPVSGAGRRTALLLSEQDSGLADVVHDRVTSSVAWSTHVRLQPAGGVRVVGRRRSGTDDLDWQTVFDPGTDVHDPAVRGQAEALVRQSRRSIG